MAEPGIPVSSRRALLACAGAACAAALAGPAPSPLARVSIKVQGISIVPA